MEGRGGSAGTLQEEKLIPGGHSALKGERGQQRAKAAGACGARGRRHGPHLRMQSPVQGTPVVIKQTFWLTHCC